VKEEHVSARLRNIGRDLQSRLKGYFDHTLGEDATPLELLQAALDELEGKVQPAGRGRRIFPYDRVIVRIAQRGADPAAIEAVFDDLAGRLHNRLAELQCEAPESIHVSAVVDEPSEAAAMPVVTVVCSRDAAVAAAPVQNARRLKLTVTVVKGQCAEPEYVFDEPVIAIGRTPEPTDALGQVRFNHVAFLELRDGINETVGRAHARLQFDDGSRHYHLFNDGSSNPTSIIRSGRMIRVAPRDPRGVRLQSGDQIQLGRAVLRVTIG
jgi:hypothetical protein